MKSPARGPGIDDIASPVDVRRILRCADRPSILSATIARRERAAYAGDRFQESPRENGSYGIRLAAFAGRCQRRPSSVIDMTSATTPLEARHFQGARFGPTPTMTVVFASDVSTRSVATSPLLVVVLTA